MTGDLEKPAKSKLVMRWSLTTSLVLHGAILAAALIVLPRPEPFKVKPQDAIQVDIGTIEDVSKRKATTMTAEKPEEKPAPKKIEEVKKAEPAPKVAEEVKKAAKEPEAAPPKSEAKKEEPKKDEPKPLDTAALAEDTEDDRGETAGRGSEEGRSKPEKRAEKKPEKKKPKLNIDEIAAFLNKIDEEKAAPAAAEQTSLRNPSKARPIFRVRMTAFRHLRRCAAPENSGSAGQFRRARARPISSSRCASASIRTAQCRLSRGPEP